VKVTKTVASAVNGDKLKQMLMNSHRPSDPIVVSSSTPKNKIPRSTKASESNELRISL
jgi:hypothetical protein